jgi:hypothetical protein
VSARPPRPSLVGRTPGVVRPSWWFSGTCGLVKARGTIDGHRLQSASMARGTGPTSCLSKPMSDERFGKERRASPPASGWRSGGSGVRHWLRDLTTSEYSHVPRETRPKPNAPSTRCAKRGRKVTGETATVIALGTALFTDRQQPAPAQGSLRLTFPQGCRSFGRSRAKDCGGRLLSWPPIPGEREARHEGSA